MNGKKRIIRRLTDRLYGGINMSWPAVIIFAVSTAVLTAVFLIFPVFDGTSFRRMGVYLEAWIFFAVIIMSNCRKPLESAVKTFVFFLISQPLIYLFQVPFAGMGFGLFRYYGTWFIWTLLTFPMAYIGWYIRRKNWLSLLILLPVLVFLASESFSGFRMSYYHFPRLLITGVFCLAQILIYLYAFTDNTVKKAAGLAAAAAGLAVMLYIQPPVQINTAYFLPDSPVLSEDAGITVMEGADAEVWIRRTGEDSMIGIQASKLGKTEFVISDRGAEYHYLMEVYMDNNGHIQVDITPQE
ncbi:MAG: hypothetical protein K6D03_11975 [Solobacterium sp.]|nr:hypothetical protein [Solobacterium sp.]